MARLRTNIIANYAGQAWLTLMGLAFVPWYLRLLGAEAFGLVGFMLSLQAVSQLLDLGVGGAVNRELARRSHGAGDLAGVRDLVRTFEALVWPTALAIGATLVLAAPWVASRWLQPGQLGVERTGDAVALMGVAIATLWPSTFYQGALFGLERQGLLNAVQATFAALRYAGVLVAMGVVAPTIEVFIAWHAIVGAAQSMVLAALTWRALPPADTAARVRWEALRGTKRFAGGMFAIGALSLLLSQVDRLALSALRPLAELGYYSLAISVAAGLGRLVLPMFNAVYPRLSRLLAAGDHAGVVTLYHQANQWLALVVAAIAAVLVAFGRDVLWLWTGDPDVVAKVAFPMALLIAGSGINGLLNLPYALQLAHGATRLAIGANAIALLVGGPLAWWAIGRWGMVAAASLWLLVNAAYFAITAPLAHRRWLPGESRDWYLRDLLPPIVAAAATATMLRWLVPPLERSVVGAASLAAVAVTVLLAAALATPAARDAVPRPRQDAA